MERVKWLSGLILAAGIWLIVAPLLLSYDRWEVTTNTMVSGIVIVALAGIGLTRHAHTWVEWGLILMGGWVLCSPTFFGYAGENVGARNDLFVGLAVIGLAIVSMLTAAPVRTGYGMTFASAEPTEEELDRF